MGRLQDRLAARGSKGEPLSLITGQESLAELQDLILQLSQACPAKQPHLQCPFFIIGTLSRASQTVLVNQLTHKACLDLFQMELDCRSQAVAPSLSECPGGGK